MVPVTVTQAGLMSADEGERMTVDPSLPILVVDDYNTMIRIIRNLLRQLGFEDVDDAPDGSIALSKMHIKRYGLVISDWNMEPMTGYELLKQVRSDPKISATPFIMVTAESKTENVIAAKQAGVNNYIVKPFNADTLKNKIEAVFGVTTPAAG
jgi:two-component system chemotaxis response regulator CheY